MVLGLSESHVVDRSSRRHRASTSHQRLGNPEGRQGGGRAREHPQTNFSSHVASQFCHPPVAQRRRHPSNSGVPRPRACRDHDDLYARGQGASHSGAESTRHLARTRAALNRPPPPRYDVHESRLTSVSWPEQVSRDPESSALGRIPLQAHSIAPPATCHGSCPCDRVLRDASATHGPRRVAVGYRTRVRARGHVVVASSGASITVRSVWATRRPVKTVLRTGSNNDTSPPAGFCGEAERGDLATRHRSASYAPTALGRLPASSRKLPKGSD